MNSFIAIYNLNGIACASDTDNTIYRLSRKDPLAIAVCPYSPIPWDRIISDYKGLGDPPTYKTIQEYARDFESYIQEFPANLEWNKLGRNELNIIFLGYGEDDIYPSVCDIQVKVNEETKKLEYGGLDNFIISLKNMAYSNWIGDFENIASVLHGSTEKVEKIAIEGQSELFDSYKKRVIEKFQGTKYEDYVKECLDKLPNDCFVIKTINHATYDAFCEMYEGLETFSIEDMVRASENIVNANIRLKHLRNGGKGLIGSTREIAVLTRAEGFTWIKHSLFAI